MKKLLIIVATLFSFTAFAQNKPDRCDIRLGVGSSLLGSGDVQTTMLDIEFNYKLNNYFTVAPSIALGNSNASDRSGANFKQGNLNLFFSPLRNNRINDFRIGAGLTAYTINDYYLRGETNYYPNGNPTERPISVKEYNFNFRNAVGGNIIIENTVTIARKYLLGAKVFTQPYLNGDINSGVMVKFGVKI